MIPPFEIDEMLNFCATTLNTPLDNAYKLHPLMIARQMQIEVRKRELSDPKGPKAKKSRKNLIDAQRRIRGYT